MKPSQNEVMHVKIVCFVICHAVCSKTGRIGKQSINKFSKYFCLTKSISMPIFDVC